MSTAHSVINVLILLNLAFVLAIRERRRLPNGRPAVDHRRSAKCFGDSRDNQDTSRGPAVQNLLSPCVVRESRRQRCRFIKRNCCDCCGCWCPVSEEPPKPPPKPNDEPCCCCCCCCPTCCPAPSCTAWDYSNACDCAVHSVCGCGPVSLYPLYPECPPTCCHHTCQSCDYYKRKVGTGKSAHQGRGLADERRHGPKPRSECGLLPYSFRRALCSHCGHVCCGPTCPSFSCCHCKRHKLKKANAPRQAFIPGWIGSPPINPSWFGLG